MFLERAYERATAELDDEVIVPSTFDGIYSQEEIAEDHVLTERLRKKFEERAAREASIETRKLAKVFEAIIAEQITMNEWFGEGVEVIASSMYDDFVNGVDGIVEFSVTDREKRHLALAIDVTFSGRVDEKFRRIKEEIADGHLAHIKYFAERDEDETLLPKQGLEDIPRVVVGAQIDTVRELAELWMERRNRELAEHEMRTMLITEIRTQLESIAAYTRKKDQTKLTQRCEEALELIKKAERGAKRRDVSDMRRDPVFDGIYVAAQHFLHEAERE